MLKQFITAVSFITLLLLSACNEGSSSNSKAQARGDTSTTLQTFVAERKPTTRHLYFQGVVTPISVTPVTSPLEGLIAKKLFNYGDPIKKNDTMFHIKSDAFEKEYQNTLSEFLKAQENYTTNDEKAQSSEELWQAGLIPRNDYNAQINAAADASLSLKLAKQKLTNLLKSGGVLDEQATKHLASKLQSLSITDVNAVNRALNIDVSLIKIHAPLSGIALMPAQQDRQGNGRHDAAVGNNVKPQEALALVGDMSGIKINIKVNEVDINHLKVGQIATITGSAFPDVTLHGKISALNTQANDEGSGSLPTFPVTITVATLDDKQQQQIHVGMSAQVQITLQSAPQITVPISAVTLINGQKTVVLYDPVSSKTKIIKVKTGKTDKESVIILEGLKEGDTIVTNNPTE